MVLVYGLSTNPHFSMAYAGELLPVVLLMGGFYIFVGWMDQPPINRRCLDLLTLCAAGLLLGTAPWCKLQSAPVTAALGVLFLASIVWRSGLKSSVSWRTLEAMAFCAGAIFTTCIMLIVLVRIGGLQDFWTSYVRGNVVHAGSTNWARSIALFVLVFLLTPLNQLLLISIGLLACLGEVKQESAAQRWKTFGIGMYAIGSLFAVCRVQRLYPHHAIFLVPPMIYMLADLISRNAGWRHAWHSSARLRAAMVLFAAAIVFLYGAYAVRYAYMIKGIRSLSRQSITAMMATVPDMQAPSDKLLDTAIGQRQWVLPDWNERIAFTVREIQHKFDIQSLTIWGVAPAVYALTGIPPSTRYAVVTPVKAGSLRNYYVAHLLSDLRASPPDLFVDVVSNAMRRSDFTEEDGYESVPELREFIDDNYTLVETLPVVRGSKPVRFFVRRSSAPNV